MSNRPTATDARELTDLSAVPKQPVIPDVKTFYDAIATKCTDFRYSATAHGRPHVQGVASAKYTHKGRDHIIDFVTQGDKDSEEKGVLYIVDRNSCKAWWFSLDYPHPGGCQIASHFLAIPYHEETLFYDVKTLLKDGVRQKPKKVPAYVTKADGTKGPVPRSVWCVGFTELNNGAFRLAVLQGGINFYDGVWDGKALIFRKVSTWHGDLKKDLREPNNANLITDANGGTSLLTFTYGGVHSLLSLYGLRFRKDGAKLDQYGETKTMSANAGFRWGAGVCEFDDGGVGIVASDKKIKTSHSNLLYFYQ